MPGNADELKWGLMAVGRPPTPAEGHAQAYARAGPADSQKLRTWSNGTCMQFGPQDPILDHDPSQLAFHNQIALVDTTIRNIRAENQGRTVHVARPAENYSDATSDNTAVDEDAFANFRTETLDSTRLPRVTLESGTYIQVPSKYASVTRSVSVHSVHNKSDVPGKKHPGAADTRFGVVYTGTHGGNENVLPEDEHSAADHPAQSANGLPATVPRGPRNPLASGRRRRPAPLNVPNNQGHSSSYNPPRRRAGRGKDGKTADVEYGKYLDELNLESTERGERIPQGDRWSGEARAIERFGVPGFSLNVRNFGEEVAQEFAFAVVPPSPIAPVAPSSSAPPAPSALEGRHFAPASVASFAAPGGGVWLSMPSSRSTSPASLAEMTGTVFGQQPGTVTPRDSSLARARRLFEQSIFSKYVVVAAAALLQATAALFTDHETGHQENLHLSNLIKHQTPPNCIDIRLPPTIAITGKTWDPTPYNWFLGTWYFAYSNSVIYQLWQDIQWTLSPTETNGIDGTLQDLTTEFYGNETFFVFKNYGIDTPTVINGQVIPDSYTYVPTPPLSYSNNTLEVMAWGYDSNDVPYAVVYETPIDAGLIGPSFDIISRDDNGPSKATLDAIYAGVKDLKNANLTALLANVVKLSQNGGRDGEFYPSCNATCVTNAYAFGVALGT